MFEHLDPSRIGARNKADAGVFMLGGFVGGDADAIFNVAEFADPVTFAGLCALGALGIKQLIDSRTTPSDRNEPPI